MEDLATVSWLAIPTAPDIVICRPQAAIPGVSQNPQLHCHARGGRLRHRHAAGRIHGILPRETALRDWRAPRPRCFSTTI